MTIEPTAAAYGLFQIAFAQMTNSLAGAMYRLRSHKDPGLQFSQLFDMPFRVVLKNFKNELKQFDGSRPVAEDLEALRKACNQMARIARWRNVRIHARVREVQDGFALYNSRTGRRLSINQVECESKIREAINVSVVVEGHLPPLVGTLNLDRLG